MKRKFLDKLTLAATETLLNNKKYLMARLCLLIILFFGCTTKGLIGVKKASVTAASFGISTPFSLDCEMFASNLTEMKQTKKVENEDLSELAELLTKSQATLDSSIDVRGTLLITLQDNKNQRLCFDQFGGFYDGLKYFKNEPLLKFLLHKDLAIP
jgi:hypothetical protein